MRERVRCVVRSVVCVVRCRCVERCGDTTGSGRGNAGGSGRGTHTSLTSHPPSLFPQAWAHRRRSQKSSRNQACPTSSNSCRYEDYSSALVGGARTVRGARSEEQGASGERRAESESERHGKRRPCANALCSVCVYCSRPRESRYFVGTCVGE